MVIEYRVYTITAQYPNKEIDNELEILILIMNLTDLDYISSAGLKILISTQKT